MPELPIRNFERPKAEPETTRTQSESAAAGEPKIPSVGSFRSTSFLGCRAHANLGWRGELQLCSIEVHLLAVLGGEKAACNFGLGRPFSGLPSGN